MIKLIILVVIISTCSLSAQLDENIDTKLLTSELESFKALNDSFSMIDVLADYEYENKSKLVLDSLVNSKHKKWWLQYFAIEDKINILMSKPEVRNNLGLEFEQYKILYKNFKESSNMLIQFLNGMISKVIKDKKAETKFRFYNLINIGDILCCTKYNNFGGFLTLKVAVIEKCENSLKVKTVIIIDDNYWNQNNENRTIIYFNNQTYELNKTTFISLDLANNNFFKCN